MSQQELPSCEHCGVGHRPALEHGNGCPVKIEFFGGSRYWSRDKVQIKDGTLYLWGPPGTWVPQHGIHVRLVLTDRLPADMGPLCEVMDQRAW